MLRMAGGPARGWYPRQRQSRPVSTENLDHLHVQGSLRAWDAAGTGSRKPLTLPPNLTPKFFNKSPRDALRRVTSLLIRKGTLNPTGWVRTRRNDNVFVVYFFLVERISSNIDSHGKSSLVSKIFC
jgi:hypothetical protein